MAEPGYSVIFNITITTAQKVEDHEIKLIVGAISGEAENYGRSVEDRAELTIKIIRQDEKDSDDSTFFTEFWNILLIIFILILVVIIAVIVNKKRKKIEKPEPQPEEAETVKPGTIPEAVITVGEVPALPSAEQPPPQLPEPTVVAESPQIAPATTEVPTLVISTTSTPGQVPETQRIPSIAEVPQLPAAEVGDDNNTKKDDGITGGDVDKESVNSII